ncbi:MAG: hypothetical protein E7178_05260 [Erysipelotrichaceae bacterium]|nr:hypothetical protein [Erysipelotrichaceae bacterium]
MENKIEELLFGKTVNWDAIKKYVDIIVEGIKDADNPKRLRIEVRMEEEFGHNLSSEQIFEIVDKEFIENKEHLNLDYCRIWKMNEYVIIVGIKR